MAGLKASTPPAPPFCDRDHPFFYADTKGYHKAVQCAVWKATAKGRNQAITVNESQGSVPPVYRLRDAEEPSLPRQMPSVDTYAFYTCSGKGEEMGMATVAVPARSHESHQQLGHRLEEAAKRLKEIEHCTAPKFNSIVFPWPVSHPKPTKKK